MRAEARRNLRNLRNHQSNPSTSTATSHSYGLQHGSGPSLRRNNEAQYVRFLENSTVYNNTFRVSSRTFSFKFRVNNSGMGLEEFLIRGFDEVIDHARRGLSENHLMGIKINVVEGYSTGPIGISFRRPSQLNGEMLLDLIFSVSQSNASFSIEESLEITATVLEPSFGGRRVRITNCSDERILQRKSQFIIDTGVSNDYLCLPKSIILGQIWVDNDNEKMIRFCENAILLSTSAGKLLRKAGVELVDGYGCEMLNIFKLQKVISNEYSIVVYSDKRNGNKIHMKTQTGGKVINLFYLKDLRHFIVIKDRKNFFGYNNECRNCLFLYNAYITEHRCINVCLGCKSPGICVSNNPTRCNICLRKFSSRECYDKHFITKIKYGGWDKNVCESIFSCRECGSLIDMSRRRGIVHTCNEFFCKICHVYVPTDHLCYIKKHLKKSPGKWILVFFDLECTQDTETVGGFKHVPDLCISQHVCYKCFEVNDMNHLCVECEGKENRFFSLDCIKDFLAFFDDFEDLKVIAISHNMKGYDGQFILSHLVNNSVEEITPTMIGCKIIRIAYKNIIFIDSYSFLTMSLSKFPEAFGLPEINKGFFPHLFHTIARLDYRGCLPPKEMYGYDNFSKTDLKKFNEWYNLEEAKAELFVLKDELLKYCSMDVTILRQGCLKFMKTFIENLDINPFAEATTLPSAVMLGFRKKFMPENTLAIIPVGGYNRKKKQSSKIGDKWIEYENEKVGYKIIPEYKIPHTNLYADGYNPESFTVYTFLGDYWHGCKKCYKYRPKRNLPDSLDDRYENTMLWIEKVRGLGYTICSIWECDFKRFLKQNPDVDYRISNATSMLYAPINVRDAIYGGLVDVFRTKYEVGPGEKIRFLDYKSLYPHCNKRYGFFKGHPTIFKKERCQEVDIKILMG